MADRPAVGASDSAIIEETDYDENISYRDVMPIVRSDTAPIIRTIPGRAESANSSIQQNNDEFSSRPAHTDRFSTPPRTPQSSAGDLRLDASPPHEQVNAFIDEVLLTINDAMTAFPNAFGLVVAFTNKICPLADHELQNIEASGEKITFAFNYFGYAYCNFSECSKAKCVAVFKALSQRAIFPERYKMLFMYFAGHGKHDFIGLQDGYLSINTIKELFEAATPQVRSIPKVLFLDRCRKKLTEKSDIILPSVENLLVINCTRLDHKAYLITDEGIGVGTMEFVQVLRQNRNCTFHDMVAQFILSVKNQYGRISQMLSVHFPNDDYASLWPDYEGSLDHYPNLNQDRRDGMCPTDEILDETTLKLTFQPPIQANHHGFQHYYIESKSQHSVSWKIEIAKLTSREYQFSERQLHGKRFRVGATYEKFGEKTNIPGNNIVFFRLGEIKPGRVQVKRIGRDHAEISWAESENVYLFRNCTCTILIGRKRLNSDTEWEIIKEFNSSGNLSHSVSSHEAVDHSYAVRYCVDNRLSSWEIADRLCLDRPQCNYFSSVHVRHTDNSYFIEWSLSPHFAHRNENDAYIAIKRREVGAWSEVQSEISVDDLKYPVSADWLESSEFMVELHFRGDGESWLCESKIVSFEYPGSETSQQCTRKVCPLLHYIVLYLIMFTASVFLSTHFTYGFHQHTSYMLGIASDVIDCKHLTSFQHYLYGTTSITEVSDSNKMDNRFLGIEVFSIPYSNIIYHSFNPNPKSDTIIFNPGNKKNKYALPSDGYNRPWYLRGGSNITVNMKFEVKVENLPQKMTLYLFDNEETYNDYFSNSDSNPRYKSKSEITLNKGEYVFMINDSAYYYMTLGIQSRYRVQLTYTVTYDVIYIDVDDYPYIQKKKIGSNGSTVHESIDLHGRNLTLCSISPIPSNSLESSTTHLQIKYAPRVVTAVIMALILLSELAMMATLTCPVWKLTNCCCKKPRRRIRYERIPMTSAS